MKKGRLISSAQNMMSGFLYQFIMLILSFVSRTVFIHSLGTEYLGLNGIFSDVMALLSMADLGFGTAMAYSFYKPLADGDEKTIASLINFYKKIYNYIAIVVLILGLACMPFLEYIVKTEEKIDNLEIYYLFSLANVVISYLFVYKTTLLTADQKQYKITNIQILTSLLKTIVQIVALLAYRNYILYLLIGVINQFICNFLASRRSEAEYPYIKEECKNNKLDPAIRNNIITNMKSVFIYKFSGTVFSATDNILISMIINTAAVGLYSNYLMLSNKLLLVEQIIFGAMTASIGNVIVKENAEKRLHIFQAMQSVSFIICGIITTCFGILANDLIYVWLGSDFQFEVNTVIAITLNTYLACIFQPLWCYRDATGMYLKTKYVMLIASVINIVLSIVLGFYIGVAGIIFASAIARLSTYFWYEPRLLFSGYFNCSVRSYYISILKNCVCVVLSILVLGGISSKINVTSWWLFFVKGSIVGICACVVFMGIYCKSDGFNIIIKKVKEVKKR